MERISEVLFGLIMVLTFTCSFSVAGAGRREVHKMLLGALGCDLAWGIIDAGFELMSGLSEKGHGIVALRAVRHTADPAAAHRVIAGALPPLLASILPETEFEVMRQKLAQLPEPPPYPRLDKDDCLAAADVFLLVFLSTFPVVIPFVFIGGARLALRVSKAVAIAMLFIAGYAFGRYSGFRPWRVGFGNGGPWHGNGRVHDRVRRMKAHNNSACWPWWFAKRPDIGPGNAGRRARRRREEPLGLQPHGRWLYHSGWDVLCGSGFHSGPQLAAPRGALQLREPAHRIVVGRL